MVALGKGDGTFGLAKTFASQAGSRIAIADFDGDGRADVARDTAAPVSTAFGLEVLRGDGQGGLSRVYEWKAPTQVGGIAAADFNRDGSQDLFVSSGPYLWFFAGKKDGTFVDPVSSDLPGGGGAIYLTDFNADGLLDALIGQTNFQSSNFIVAIGDGGGHFSLTSYSNGYGSGYDPLVVGDFTGDGRTDVLDLRSSLTLYAGAAPSDLTITLSHATSFGQGQASADYTIGVQNKGPASTSDTVIARVLPIRCARARRELSTYPAQHPGIGHSSRAGNDNGRSENAELHRPKRGE